MDGIALAEQVNGIWPNCRIIFLSGYKDVDYAMAAIRNNVLDYVMKTEDDARLLSAVRHAIESIKSQRRTWNFSELAEYKKSYRYNILSDIVFSDRYNKMSVSEKLWDELEIPLLREEKMALVMGRVLYGRNDGPSDVRQEISDTVLVHNSFMLHMKRQYRVFYDYRDGLMIWIIQPRDSSVTRDAFGQIPGMVEEIQEFCHTQKITVNFAINLSWKSLNEIYFAFQKTRQVLVYPTQEAKNTILIIEDEEDKSEPCPTNPIFVLENAEERIEQLRLSLLRKEKKTFFEHFKDLMKSYSGGIPLNNLAAVRHYYMIVNILAEYVERYLPGREFFKEEILDCFQVNQYSSWQEATDALYPLIEKIFSAPSGSFDFDVGNTIKILIQQNLSKNFTLIELADIVHMNPYYLSRYFKKNTGVTLSEYISTVKMKKAKELLSYPNIKVYEVSQMLGFDSNSYFSKCFKKEFGITPQKFQQSISDVCGECPTDYMEWLQKIKK